ncbi:unnamed protein product, partial [Bubo scandiacus]
MHLRWLILDQDGSVQSGKLQHDQKVIPLAIYQAIVPRHHETQGIGANIEVHESSFSSYLEDHIIINASLKRAKEVRWDVQPPSQELTWPEQDHVTQRRAGPRGVILQTGSEAQGDLGRYYAILSSHCFPVICHPKHSGYKVRLRSTLKQSKSQDILIIKEANANYSLV